MSDYKNLRELLEKEKFPLIFTFKFVGKNSSAFEKGVENFENAVPTLVMKNKRLSSHEKHVSFTYELNAQNPNEIVHVFSLIAKIPDVLVVL